MLYAVASLGESRPRVKESLGPAHNLVPTRAGRPGVLPTRAVRVSGVARHYGAAAAPAPRDEEVNTILVKLSDRDSIGAEWPTPPWPDTL